MKSKFYTDSFRWLSALIMLLRPHSSAGITHNLVGFSGIWTLQQCKDVLIPAVQRQCCTYVTEFLHLFTQTGWHGDLEIAASIGNQSAGHYFGFSIPQLDSVETEAASPAWKKSQTPEFWLVGLPYLKMTSWRSKTILWWYFCSEKRPKRTKLSLTCRTVPMYDEEWLLSWGHLGYTYHQHVNPKTHSYYLLFSQREKNSIELEKKKQDELIMRL